MMNLKPGGMLNAMVCECVYVMQIYRLLSSPSSIHLPFLLRQIIPPNLLRNLHL